MSKTSDNAISGSLFDTLTLALTQCQDQIRQLAAQAKVIDDLREENERLRQELIESKTTCNAEVEARYKTQFQHVFQQVVEKQAEIDRLKEKMRTARTKAKQVGFADIVSSPTVSIFPCHADSTNDHPLSSSPTTQVAQTDEIKQGLSRSSVATEAGFDMFQTPKPSSKSSPPREPLKDISNLPVTEDRPGSERRLEAPKALSIEKAMLAIPDVAEDGEEYAGMTPRKTVSKDPRMSNSVYHRLGNLLEAGDPSTVPLLRTRNKTPPMKRKAPDAHVTEEERSAAHLTPPATEPSLKKARMSLTSLKRRATPDPEDEEPFRARPVKRLSLMHFKLNPKVNSGLDFAYNEVVRGEERRCLPGCTRSCCAGFFRMLADTLPQVNSLRQPVSDDELLLGYLGHGAEERIRTLTPKARENLIHDARTQLAANTYGKMHRGNHERAQSPPGFWRTDMPGSQEHRSDRDTAKVLEREEVARRYNEAMRGDGRWIFADE